VGGPEAFDLLRFLFIQLGDVVSRVTMNMQQLIEFRVDSLGIPVFGALNEKGHIQVMSVARPCHSSVSGLKISQEIPYRTTVANAMGLAVKVPKSVNQERKCIFRTSSIVLEPSAGSLVPGHKSDLPLS
jgi:hypothetical protein